MTLTSTKVLNRFAAKVLYAGCPPHKVMDVEECPLCGVNCASKDLCLFNSLVQK